jgi:hypothetical protein
MTAPVTFRSSDGSFRVECITELDERAPAWERTRIVRERDGKEILFLPLHSVKGKIEFPQPGIVILPLVSRFGKPEWLRVNVATEKFALHDDEPDQPLSVLHSRLELPGAATPFHRNPTIRDQIRDICLVFFGVILSLGGVWMALASKTAHDRAIGALGTILFAATAVSASISLYRQAQCRQQRRAQGVIGNLERRWLRWRPYLPLAICLFELPWCLLIILGIFFVAGDEPFSMTGPQEKLLDVIARLPLFAGLIVGLVALTRRWATTLAARIALLLGTAVCAVLLYGLISELAH